ncbi:hypothetical protein KUCAC02_019507 [Chaenocephalus aceratus]|uniref:Uncharacterized protein n=1 Tax=Chaenocephalus aceratus TaxID=36190 RepID=A0ACB9VPV9_CHAAC|nr:hypothetical protein KUCAC02_019507 [Chaenocephalus aceratus]
MEYYAGDGSLQRMQRNKSPLTTTLAQQKSKVAMVTDPELAKLQKLEELLEPCRYVTALLGESSVSPVQWSCQPYATCSEFWSPQTMIQFMFWGRRPLPQT